MKPLQCRRYIILILHWSILNVHFKLEMIFQENKVQLKTRNNYEMHFTSVHQVKKNTLWIEECANFFLKTADTCLLSKLFIRSSM